MWRVRLRKEAIHTIEKLGGSVILGDEPRVPRWLEPFVFPDVLVVDLAHTKATNADLARIKSLLKPLETLKLNHTEITAGGLEPLAGLTVLETLFLAGTAVTDADLAHIEQFPNLIRLDLSGTPVTDGGLEHLAGLTTLEDLDISDTQVTDAGLQHLRGLTVLARLELEENQVSATSVEHLARLDCLQWILVYVTEGNGKRARNHLGPLTRTTRVAVGLLRPRPLPIWAVSHSSRWETSPAGIAEMIQSKAELKPEEAAKLLEVLADTLAHGKWGVLRPFRAPRTPVVEEDRIGGVEEFVQAVKIPGADNSNFPRTWLYAKSEAAKEAIPALLELLEDPDYEVRRRFDVHLGPHRPGRRAGRRSDCAAIERRQPQDASHHRLHLRRVDRSVRLR